MQRPDNKAAPLFVASLPSSAALGGCAAALQRAAAVHAARAAVATPEACPEPPLLPTLAAGPSLRHRAGRRARACLHSWPTSPYYHGPSLLRLRPPPTALPASACPAMPVVPRTRATPAVPPQLPSARSVRLHTCNDQMQEGMCGGTWRRLQALRAGGCRTPASRRLCPRQHRRCCCCRRRLSTLGSSTPSPPSWRMFAGAHNERKDWSPGSI